jgi:hypothetical protein
MAQGGGATAGTTAIAGSSGVGGAPEPVFDASALSVVGEAGSALCRQSEDERQLLVAVTNGGATETGPTVVRVATDDAATALDLETPWLMAGAGAELSFDRGALAGFVGDWRFTITVDPEGVHGEPHSILQGECEGLRGRTEAGMAALGGWYHTDTGLWDLNDWWTSANQLETVIDY